MAKKHPGGRPALFKTVEELDDKIKSYFENGVKVKIVVIGKSPNQEKVTIPVPTISGLALYIGFESRQSFYDYEKKPEFTYTIKKARLTIEVEYEGQLQVGNVAGAIFALKNMGWKDKTEIDQTVTNITPLSQEEIDQAGKKLDDEY